MKDTIYNGVLFQFEIEDGHITSLYWEQKEITELATALGLDWDELEESVKENVRDLKMENYD